MKNNELVKWGGVYLPPQSETIEIVTECRLLDGSPDSTLQDLVVNDVISEGF